MKKICLLAFCLLLAVLPGCKKATETVAPQAPVQGAVYDYCYSNLNDHQKDIYNKILEGVKNLQTERIFLTEDGTDIAENVNLAYGAVSADHPEIFWLKGEYRLLTLANEKFYIKVEYDIDPTTRDGQAAALENRVQKIMEAVKDMTPPEKERYFHDYLCNNVTYLYDGVSTRYTAFGALVNGKAVCEGYARAMQLLCKRAGINCTIIKGVSDDEAHMWNALELYGEWYELDVTWDDLDADTPRYKYFNLTTEQISKSHKRYDSVTGVGSGISLKGLKYNLNPPICTATEYAYKQENSKD